MRIAMTGNPNSGKTTTYNAITGRVEHVGNWAGVTVDKKEHAVKKAYYEGTEEIIVVDLPGAYSMSPFTSEESITSDYVKNENPDVIINVVDSTNLSRSLFFTTQLLELGVPVVVALNKDDVNQKKHNTIDAKALSKALNCPVVKTDAMHQEGLKELVKTAVEASGKGQEAPYVQGEVDLESKAAVEEADRKRFTYVNDLVKSVEERSTKTNQKTAADKVDKILMHPVLGLLIFAAVMFLVFYISQTTVGTWLSTLLAGLIDLFKEWVAGRMEDANPLLQAVLVDGIIGGVGAVVGFLPLVMVMYFLIALLEDCGYMARATVVLDPIFKKVGLSGKSVIPMVIGTGCGVPAIMACRTIKNERERRATAMLCTFMPCGAKLPVIALFAGAFFPKARFIGVAMYFVGIALILLGALIIREVTGARFQKSYFIMELPEYKAPSVVFALKSMLERGKSYLVKAGTVILVCNTVVQIMASFTPKFAVALEDSSDSILALVAGPFAYLLIPVVGILSWRLAAAAITGFIAKENVVGTIATVYCITNFIDVEELALTSGATDVAAALQLTKVAALAYLMFNLFTPPCFAALGAMNSEMKSAKWLAGAIVFQLSIGFTIGFLVNQFGTLITTGAFAPGVIGGAIFTVAFVVVLVALSIRGNRLAKKEA